MGLFKGLSQVKVNRDYAYEKQGNYLTRIDRIKVGKLHANGVDTRTRKREEFIAIDQTVIAVLPSSEPGPYHTVGEEITHFIMVTGSEYADKEWAKFLSGLLGVDVSKLDDPDVLAVAGGKDFDDFLSNDDPKSGPVQPVRGTVIEKRNQLVATKESTPEAPKHFTRIKTVREVPANEVLKTLGGSNSDLVKRFFPNQYLENQIAAATAK